MGRHSGNDMSDSRLVHTYALILRALRLVIVLLADHSLRHADVLALPQLESGLWRRNQEFPIL